MVDLLKKFNVEVGEASTKANDLAKLFEANGVALRNQDGTLRSTKDLFYEITNLIANAKSQQEAAVIAQMAFWQSSGRCAAIPSAGRCSDQGKRAKCPQHRRRNLERHHRES